MGDFAVRRGGHEYFDSVRSSQTVAAEVFFHRERVPGGPPGWKWIVYFVTSPKVRVVSGEPVVIKAFSLPVAESLTPTRPRATVSIRHDSLLGA